MKPIKKIQHDYENIKKKKEKKNEMKKDPKFFTQ